jgi:hypothetical protein
MSSLIPRRDPLRLLFSRAPWASAWYLLGYLIIGSFLFAVVFTTIVTATMASVTLAGLPVLVAATGVTRWCAAVERSRLRPFGPVEGGYQAPAGHGLLAALRTRWRDSATWRDIGYLAGLWAPLFTLDLVVLVTWLTLLAGITLPAWYWAPWQTVHGVRYHGYQLGYFPNGPHASGSGTWGLYVDTLPRALAVAATCLVLVAGFNYVLVATVKLHVATARTLLRAPEDPLREAKEVLLRPGPLSGFSRQAR